MIYSTLHLIFLWNIYYYEGIPEFINTFIISKYIYYVFCYNFAAQKFCCTKHCWDIRKPFGIFFSELPRARLDERVEGNKSCFATSMPQWPKNIAKVTQSPHFWVCHRGSWEGFWEETAAKIVLFRATVDRKKSKFIN